MAALNMFKQSRHLCELFERVMQVVLADISPERAFIAYREKNQSGSGFPTPYATHGLSLSNLFTTEDISTEIIRKALGSGEASLVADAINAPHLNSRTSVLISGLRSVLTVPIRHSSGLVIGLIYADSRISAGAFKPAHLELARSLSSEVLAALPFVEKRMKSEPVTNEQKVSFPEVRRQAIEVAQTDPDRAIEILDCWARTCEPKEEQGMAHGVRGSLLEQNERYEEALEALSYAIWLLGRHSSAPSEGYSLMLNNLAGVQVKLGHLDRALGLLKASFSLWQRLKLPDERQHKGLAAASYNLAKVYIEREQRAEAIGWLHKALESSEVSFGQEHANTKKIRQMLSQLQEEENPKQPR